MTRKKFTRKKVEEPKKEKPVKYYKKDIDKYIKHYLKSLEPYSSYEKTFGKLDVLEADKFIKSEQVQKALKTQTKIKTHEAPQTVLNEDIMLLIESYARKGVTDKTISDAVGISVNLLSLWKRKAKQALKNKDPEKRRYINFLVRYNQARAEGKIHLLSEIRKAGLGEHEWSEIKIEKDGKGEITKEIITNKKAQPQWQALAWILRITSPDEFGEKAQVNNTDDHVEDLKKEIMNIFNSVPSKPKSIEDELIDNIED